MEVLRICSFFFILAAFSSIRAAGIKFTLDSSDGSSFFRLKNSGEITVFSIASNGGITAEAGVKTGNSSLTADGTIRYTGTDFEGRKSGSWVSLTKDGTGADHGLLTGLSDDDHSQYHNNTRGDDRYFQKTEFLVVSAGAGDSGKPVKLDAGGKIDDSTLLDSDIDHGSITGLSDDDHVQYLKVDGTRSLSGSWDIGDTLYIAADKIRARDNAGLYLQDDGGNGIFVKDGGYTGIGVSNPQEALALNGALKLGAASGTADGTMRWTGTDLEGRKGGAWVSLTAVGSSKSFVILKDIKSSGTNGGAFSSGSWVTRILNTEEYDPGNLCSLNTGTGEFTLSAGTYDCYATAPAYYVSLHRIRLYNVSDSTVVKTGTNALSGLGQTASNSVLYCRFTIAVAKSFRIEHRCSATNATDGRGTACSFGDSEIYTFVELCRVN